jgi:hypothetical protein
MEPVELTDEEIRTLIDKMENTTFMTWGEPKDEALYTRLLQWAGTDYKRLRTLMRLSYDQGMESAYLEIGTVIRKSTKFTKLRANKLWKPALKTGVEDWD